MILSTDSIVHTVFIPISYPIHTVFLTCSDITCIRHNMYNMSVNIDTVSIRYLWCRIKWIINCYTDSLVHTVFVPISYPIQEIYKNHDWRLYSLRNLKVSVISYILTPLLHTSTRRWIKIKNIHRECTSNVENRLYCIAI